MSEFDEVKKQVDIIIMCKQQLDKELGSNKKGINGESLYPDSILIACHNWVNKWLMRAKIQAERNKPRSYPKQQSFDDENKDKTAAGQNYGGDYPSGKATDKQKKFVYAIHKQKDVPLPENYNDLSYDEATEYIEKHKD